MDAHVSGEDEAKGARLGALIVARRQELDLSRQELARRLHVAPAQVLDLERSRRRWQTRLLPALAEALDLPQLELAIAAGVITDLPAVPRTPGVPGWLLASVERQELVALLDQLDTRQVAFVLAVASALLTGAPASPSP